MRRLEYYIILTADGFYADPDGGLGHYEPAEDEHRYANGLMREAGDVVMSRVMYTDAMVYWDSVDASDEAVPEVEREFARFWQETPKHIVSRGRPDLGPNADLVEGDAVEAVRRLKETEGPDDHARYRFGAVRDADVGRLDRHLSVPGHPGRDRRGEADLRRSRQPASNATRSGRGRSRRAACSWNTSRRRSRWRDTP